MRFVRCFACDVSCVFGSYINYHTENSPDQRSGFISTTQSTKTRRKFNSPTDLSGVKDTQIKVRLLSVLLRMEKYQSDCTQLSGYITDEDFLELANNIAEEEEVKWGEPIGTHTILCYIPVTMTYNIRQWLQRYCIRS